MPQMAPISWLMLFFMFSFIFIMFNILNYTCFYNMNFKNIDNKTNKNKKINNKMIWKW